MKLLNRWLHSGVIEQCLWSIMHLAFSTVTYCAASRNPLSRANAVLKQLETRKALHKLRVYVPSFSIFFLFVDYHKRTNTRRFESLELHRPLKAAWKTVSYIFYNVRFSSYFLFLFFVLSFFDCEDYLIIKDFYNFWSLKFVARLLSMSVK